MQKVERRSGGPNRDYPTLTVSQAVPTSQPHLPPTRALGAQMVRTEKSQDGMFVGIALCVGTSTYTHFRFPVSLQT